MIEVGAAVCALPLPVGSPMAGFAARSGPSVGVLDQLTVRAVVLAEVVIVAVDVCGLDRSTCEAVQRAVRPDSPHTVLVHATHTHAAPGAMPGALGGAAPDAVATLVTAAVTAAAAATEAREPCTVEHAAAPVTGVAHDRRHDGRRLSPPALSLVARTADGRVHARIVTFPCHPVVLDAANRLHSADYVGHVRRALERYDGGAPCVFLTGCAGDVNTGHAAAASFSDEPAPDRTPQRAERVGARVADALVRGRTRRVACDAVAVSRHDVDLPLTPVDPGEVAREAARWRAEIQEAQPGRRRLLEAWLVWSDAMTAEDAEEVPSSWRGSVTVVRWGDVALVALPGEPFLVTAEAVARGVRERTRGAVRDVLVVGYTDGCPGYVPPAEAYEEGGYEVVDAHRYYGMPAPFARGAAEILQREAVMACPMRA
ncbi:alkaline ceramidase [Serinibacter arcticus]|uniref:Alkaline ceramidase n=1 Tax=Serinibacter arcticus TaxID=1655435 RepID=A0A2U1ZXC3_9MICO|nr:alkaline ceramidase [Serinibacter arcticus]PWD51636.1 alkaline ceramidase [Serinibacter arcticus]